MDNLQLEAQMCFPIYALSRQITAHYRPLLEELAITYPQYLVMLVLWEKKTQTVKELCEQLYLDSGTLTPLLKRLEQKKLLTRKRSETDERLVDITLTTEGQALKQKARQIPARLLCSLQWKEEQVVQLRKKMYDLLHKLEQ